MRILEVPQTALSWLGRQGTRAVATLVVIGIALPSVDAILKPYLTGAVFVLLCIAFTRVDVVALRAHARRPGVVLAATAWTSIAVPTLFGVSGLAIGMDKRAPALFLALMLQGIAPPMMAAPALAALMGLDATLVLATLITSTALIPVTAPLFARLFVGPDLPVSPLMLAGKLFAILAGAALVGAVARRIIGFAAIQQRKVMIDGLNILVLLVFVAAVMDGIGARVAASPMTALWIGVLAFTVFFALFFLTARLFRFAGRDHAVALGLMASQRNLGLMLAGVGTALPDVSWLYFALAQFPIYLSPQLLRPMAQRTVDRTHTELLFSYGTLQLEAVQMANFGRRLSGTTDVMRGFALVDLPIDDPEVVRISGKAVHTMAKFTGRASDLIPGMVFAITPAELRSADSYEVAAVKRVAVTLQSGVRVWVYVDASYAPSAGESATA